VYGDFELKEMYRKEKEMQITLVRRTLAIALAILLAATAGAAAQTKTQQPLPERYTGTTANMTSGAGSKITIHVFRWSSDAERERVLLSLSPNDEKNPNELVKALASLPTVGVIWAAGPAGYALKYAHRRTETDGSERIVFVTDRSFGSLEHPAWKIAGQAVELDKLYTVIELHLNGKGRGDGKMSLTTPVTVDDQTKTISLTNYDKASTLLTDVQRQPKS
jgi:hypothetical protein